MNDPVLLVSAGDPSGDTAAARLLKELVAIQPTLTAFGLGGRQLKAGGQEQLAPPERLAVMGFWEIASQMIFFRRLLRRCASEIEKRRPQALVLVDYPGFNLRLAARVRKLGIPVVYYISPQVWAWGKRRLRRIRELVDLMLVILPFEKQLYDEHQIVCRYVGHYLLEAIPSEMTASPVPAQGHLALLPGSRPQEIRRHLPLMIAAAGRMWERHGVKSIIAAISGACDYERYLTGETAAFCTIRYDDTRRIIAEASLVLTASGTATLETAIIGRPMVVVYRTSWATYQIARRLVKSPYIALANLVLGQKVAPELIQSQATTAAVVGELERFILDAAYRERTASILRQTAGLLGGVGASRRAAEAIMEVVRKEC